MDTNFEDNKKEIVHALQDRITDFKCPVCGQIDFILAGGYFAHDVQKNLKNRQIGGASIPTIPLICKNCGYIAEFAAGSLGLLPKENKNNSKEKND